MNKKSKVLIAGAGPVGLTAALLLGHKGIPVMVLEAQDAISEELRALADWLGLVEIVLPSKPLRLTIK